ncbi:MAG: outer membrane beta-barrel protein [Pseudomonadota bacterium]
MRNGKFLMLLLVLGLLFVVTPDFAEAHGRYYGPRTLPESSFRHRPHAYIGGQLMGMAILADQTDDPRGFLGHGAGGGLFGGVRLLKYLSVEGNWTVTWHDEIWDEGNARYLDSLYLMTFTGDFKFHIPTYTPFEPYIQGGLGYSFVGATYAATYYDYDAIMSQGLAFNVGVGLDFWLGPWFSVGGRLVYRGMRFGDPVTHNTTGMPAYSSFVNSLSIDMDAKIHF